MMTNVYTCLYSRYCTNAFIHHLQSNRHEIQISSPAHTVMQLVSISSSNDITSVFCLPLFWAGQWKHPPAVFFQRARVDWQHWCHVQHVSTTTIITTFISVSAALHCTKKQKLCSFLINSRSVFATRSGVDLIPNLYCSFHTTKLKKIPQGQTSCHNCECNRRST